MNSKTLLFNDNWQFALTENDAVSALSELERLNWYNVELPHDWLVGDTANLYKSGDGWYKKSFMLSAEDVSGRVMLNFDGVYMNSTVYVNGKEVGTWTYGYSAFEFDITDYVKEGENTVIVKVNHRSPNTRWYSGAGIYRDVELKIRPSTYIAHNGIYIHSEKTDKGFTTEIETTVCGKAADISVKLEVIAPDETIIAGFEQKASFGGGEECFLNKFDIENPALWDFDTPNVYTMRVTLSDGANTDTAEVSFGYKTAEFIPEKGLVLNGRQVKLHGVCMHHDLGALGAAYNFTALFRQLKIMKEMGVNSIRTSHNMPVKQLMDICDHIGLLVDCESFDMWENPKTEFDNARFFKEKADRDVKSWVERDRNHPSLIMWSIGNEISDTNNDHGIEITQRLADLVKKYDPKGNAPATIGSNFMTSETAQKCSDILKIAGYNYTERLYNEHHEKYPDWIIYGSETSSAVRSRGIYHFPSTTPILTHADLQCSDLDNSFVGWGCSARKAWRMDRDTDFCFGQYIWTGFDYIGEPTPYSTKNSYFGAVDTAGFPKDIYYFYQSVWTDPETNPMLHIVPSCWDFSPNVDVDVLIYSNADEVELFLNGRSLGRQQMRLADSEDMRAHFVVPFEKGTLSAKGYRNGEVVAEDKVVTCGDPVKVQMKADRSIIFANGRDISFIEITVTDSEGIKVGNARNRIKLEVSGDGRLVGMDNGDSTDYDSYKGDNRRLFSGKLLAMIQSTKKAGTVTVKAVSEGLEGCEITIDTTFTEDTEGYSVVTENRFPVVTNEYTREIPVRKIELIGGGEMTKDNPTSDVKLKLYPANATYSDISWKIVRDTGVELPLATVTPTADGAMITALGDGEFLARAFVNNGGDVPQVFADVKFTVSGMGAATKNPYTFSPASLLDESNVDVRIVENGAIANFTERTVMTYNSFDFGKTGTDKITLHIGTCFDFVAEVWEGTPENGELLISAEFKNNQLWCGYAPQTFKLPRRLKGIKNISVVIDKHVTFGGFEFATINRAFDEQFTAECDSIYGDEYEISGRSVVNIGNNVIINYEGMDFGEEGTHIIFITGRTPNPENPIQLRYTPADGEQKSCFIRFAHTDGTSDITTNIYEIPELKGVNDISFVFLPGCKFDFVSFRFKAPFKIN